ncbi:hypothetical protein [Nonomuraea gerenzanensis]|uniref:Uncharacterized protein n=1 Tax=Nonomuraea gerenzanensis TaxID=93944 RepID=A0A1M4EBY7_9ACTN|nr:hypothetical protein [Nonomuraea gerenzanensis]UBU18566.1 hypothetical protein LCN96_27155 [Nonomuraea gerenzanensis]SBO96409.1 hypothetical protein BN4615_P5925 [Nonomuraea gerenzanensis]
MTFAVARTRDEAHLYLDLHPCACGSVDTTWDSGLVSAEGGLASRYAGTCESCGRQREYLFGVPERPIMPAGYPTFGGAEPSQLLDAGEWLWVADLTAGNVPVDDGAEAHRTLSVATAAVEEVVKFIPPGADEVPDDGFWSQRGRELRAAEPGRFQLERLLIVRDTYRDLAARHA